MKQRLGSITPLLTSLTAIAVASILGYSVEAAACSCGIGLRTSPQDGDVGVPTNTWIRTQGPPMTLPVPSFLDLEETATGALVRFDRSIDFAPETTAFFYVGTEELRPHTAYRYTLEEQDHAFTTGAGPDSAPPTVRGKLRAEYEEHGDSLFTGISSCGESRFWRVELPEHEDGQTPQNELFLMAFFGRTAEGAKSNPLRVVHTHEDAAFGQRACTFDNVDVDSPEARFLSIAFVDRAGNVSERSEPAALSGCGCFAQTGGAQWLAMIALAGFGLLRRRPRIE